MYVGNGSDGRCIVAVRLIVGVRYLERPLREVLLYIRGCVSTPYVGMTRNLHYSNTKFLLPCRSIEDVYKPEQKTYNIRRSNRT